MALQPLLVRGMQACAHETCFDCPYFEQMQYVGDLRLEALTQYVMTRDDRLTRKGLFLVDASRHASGLTESRYPVRRAAVHPVVLAASGSAPSTSTRAGATTRGFVRALLPGVRGVLEAFLARRVPSGVVETPEGWNDTERTRELERSALTNWLLAWTLRLAAELEDGFGEPEPAARCRRLASEIAAASDRAFWSEPQRALQRQPRRDRHERARAVARAAQRRLPAAASRSASRAGSSRAARRRARTSTRCTTCSRRPGCMQRPDVVFDRLGLWSQMRRDGLRTPIESAEPTRSDCHAWGSHPLYHFFATLLGIRPAGWGFRQVEIAPQLGRLEHASGRLVHPAGGEIVVDVEQKDGALRGRVTLPPGLTGTLRLPAGSRRSQAGETRF